MKKVTYFFRCKSVSFDETRTVAIDLSARRAELFCRSHRPLALEPEARVLLAGNSLHHYFIFYESQHYGDNLEEGQNCSSLENFYVMVGGCFDKFEFESQIYMCSTQ
jgi:hypothetical protein